MQKEIINFIKNNKVATVCCMTDENTPYCFHCFYAYDEQAQLLFFKSSPQTFHAPLLDKHASVSGSILPDKMELLIVKGIQFCGKILYTDIPGNIDASAFYHKKHPIAMAKPGHVWCIQLTEIKMTDNTNLFGKKLHWVKTADLSTTN